MVLGSSCRATNTSSSSVAKFILSKDSTLFDKNNTVKPPQPNHHSDQLQSDRNERWSFLVDCLKQRTSCNPKSACRWALDTKNIGALKDYNVMQLTECNLFGLVLV